MPVFSCFICSANDDTATAFLLHDVDGHESPIGRLKQRQEMVATRKCGVCGKLGAAYTFLEKEPKTAIKVDLKIAERQEKCCRCRECLQKYIETFESPKEE